MKLFFHLPLLLFSITLTAQKQLDYIENNGQWETEVKYKTNIHGGSVFIKENGLTYDLVNLKDISQISEIIHDKNQKLTPQNSIVNHYAYNVNFVNGNINRFISEQKRSYYQNYLLGNDTTKWASKVPLFGAITGKELYPNIDIKLFSQNSQLKYDFIVKPTGNYKNIKLEYIGLNEMTLQNGNLILKTTLGEVIEQKPIVYQVIDGIKIEIKASYALSKNRVSFQVEAFNPNYDLIIDPVVVASTYSGSTEEIYGHTATYDNDGNIYAAGAGFSPGGLPTTTGAYQQIYAGKREICINKYNPTGSYLLYSTYLGGSDNDYPHSLYNYNGNLYILGSSRSSDFPTTNTAFDITHNGFSDIIVSVLDNTGGTLLASTFIGGTDEDGLNNIRTNYGDSYRGEIVVDNMGNCYVSSVSSSINFPTSTGTYQSSNGGLQDGVAFKLNSTLSTLVFSTYLGGFGDDAAYGVLVDGSKVYVSGTANSNFLGNGGAFNYNNNQDGFIIALNGTGTTVLNKSYFGSSGDDQAFFVDKDLSGNIYILGQTKGTVNATAGRYNGGNGLFITKFNSALTNRIYTTTTKEMAPIAFLVDDCGFIYASGHGELSGLTGFRTTPNAIQSSSAGFYLMVLNPDATTLNFGSYYGAIDSHVDGGTSRFDKRGVIYQATCTDAGFPTLSNAYSTNANGGEYDVTVFKIDFEISEIKARAIPSPDSVGCAPYNVNFINTSGGNKYFWDFGDSSPVSNTKNPNHTFVNPGVYNVRLIAIDSTSTCILPDTVFIRIEVLSNSSITTSPNDFICAGENAQLSASGASTYVWSPGTGLSNPNIANPIATPAVTTTYRVIGTSRCNTDTGFVTVTVNSISTTASNDTLICLGESAQLNATGGNQYQWSPVTGLSNPSIANPIASPTTTTTYTVTITSAQGCSNTEQVTVNIQQGLPVPVTSNDITICVADITTLTASGGSSYFWSSSSYPITNPTAQNINVSPTNTTLFYVDLTNVCGTVRDSVLVTTQKPIAQISPNDIVCYTDTVALWANGGQTYQWLPTNKVFSPTNANTLAYPVTPTEFTVIVTDNLGCKDTAKTKIDFFPIPIIDAGADKIITFGESVILTPSYSPGIVSWDSHHTLSCTNCVNPTSSPEKTTVYTVYVQDKNGCIASDIVKVNLNGVIYAPNAFTPNGDGINDIFYVKGENILEYELLIFNRWGQIIFKSNDMEEGWDGTFKGSLSKTDAYTWKLKYSDIIEKNTTKYGHVNLLK